MRQRILWVAPLGIWLAPIAGCDFTIAGETFCAGECDDDDEGSPDAGPEFVPLLTRDWSLDPASEAQVCATRTVEEDFFIGGVRPLVPIGTHHSTISFGPKDRADEDFPCDFTFSKQNVIIGSGPGTEDFVFPDGVGIRLKAGQQLGINLHIFNTSDEPLSGTSGGLVKVIPEAEIQYEAEATAMADFALSIPPGMGQTATATCTIKEAGTIFTWWPHMHAMGRHSTVRLNGEVVLDGDYTLEDQRHYQMTLEVQAGDVIEHVCTFDNPTDRTIGMGSGTTDDEMCFLGFWRYPATGESICDPPF